MNFEKYTDRARGFIQSAQSLALREGHQQFAPEHLLKVLLDDPEGLAAGLIDRSGGNSREALRAVEALLLALAIEKDNEAGKILSRASVAPQNLNTAINALRKGRTADSSNAEQ